MGKMINFDANGGSADGYLAEPDSPGAPGVVVIQEWWGLLPHIKEVADRLASAGFLALAPDLYRGNTASHPDEARRHMMALSMDGAAADLRGAVDVLVEHPLVADHRVGTIGFCLGGGLALFLASVDPRVEATVDFYGILPVPGAKPDLASVRGAVQGHFGANDDYIGQQDRDKLRDELEAAGVSTDFHVYDAEHAFFNQTRPDVFHPEAAGEAWARSLRFLHEQLIAAGSTAKR